MLKSSTFTWQATREETSCTYTYCRTLAAKKSFRILCDKESNLHPPVLQPCSRVPPDSALRAGAALLPASDLGRFWHRRVAQIFMGLTMRPTNVQPCCGKRGTSSSKTAKDPPNSSHV